MRRVPRYKQGRRVEDCSSPWSPPFDIKGGYLRRVTVDPLILYTYWDGWWGIKRASGVLPTDGVPEGNEEDMQGVLRAIRERSTYYAKRIEIFYHEPRYGFFISSPRNSTYRLKITVKEAQALADQIEKMLSERGRLSWR